VTGIKTTGEKTLMLFSGRAHPELAEEIAQDVGIAVSPTDIRDFADGEIYARFEESVRGCDAFVVESMTTPVNQWLMETLVMCDALKRGSAKRITVVLPYYPYARQDKKSRGREPISARLIADLYKTAGADRILTVDLHTSQIQGFFDGPVDHLFALPLLADYVAANYDVADIAVVAPDSGRVRVAERWTQRLGGTPLAFIHKTRDLKVANSVVANRVVGEVDGRTCVLVDDMIDTAGTITKAAEALFDAGAASVVVAATHGILSGPAVDRLKNSHITEVVLTNTLPIGPDQRCDKLTVLSIAPLIARAISEVFADGSVTSLFDGNA
jgi:ribose-phosphate pyrophosphokinase